MGEKAVITEYSGGKVISSPDGLESEMISDFAYQAIAAELQGDCKDSATGLQPDGKGVAPEPQTRFIPNPDQAGKPLEEDEIYKAIEPLLANPKWIQENSKGKYSSIEDIFKQQNSMPKPLIKALHNIGIFVKPEVFARQIFPIYRLKQKDKEINKLTKINYFLIVCLIVTLSCFCLKDGQKTDETTSVITVEKTDSVCTYAELHEYINTYSEAKKIKIYPYSERVILERINAKKINNIEGIKDEIESRINELQKR